MPSHWPKIQPPTSYGAGVGAILRVLFPAAVIGVIFGLITMVAAGEPKDGTAQDGTSLATASGIPTPTDSLAYPTSTPPYANPSDPTGTWDTAPGPSTWRATPDDPLAQARPDDCFVSVGDQRTGRLELASSCEPGTFTVIKRLDSTRDRSRCRPTAGGYTVTDPSADLVLCLRYNYADPGGYAEVNDCLIMTKKSGGHVALAVPDTCAHANIVVTGRKSGAADRHWCGSDGSIYWSAPSGYSWFSYTLCYRYR